LPFILAADSPSDRNAKIDMRRSKSDIPAGVKERAVRPYKEVRSETKTKWIGPSSFIQLEIRECVSRGKVVGQRSYDAEGRLSIETPLKDGKKHGSVVEYYDNGEIHSVEPYFEGMMHGTAKQYDARGRIIGTYKMTHGTGYDVWRNQFPGGPVYVSEIHPMRAGLPHGFEWWLNEDQQSVHEEKHWFNGQWHGIERDWNYERKLSRGYPKYWVRDKSVTKRQYIAAARKDPTLPPFRLKDNLSKREFPREIRRLLNVPKKK